MNSPFKSYFKIIRRGQQIQLHHVKHFSVYRYNKDIHHQKNNKNKNYRKNKSVSRYNKNHYRNNFSNENSSSYQPYGELLYTTNAVLSALKHAKQTKRKKFYKLYLQSNILYGDKRSDINYIEDIARDLEIPIEYGTKHVMNNMTSNEKHQGAALDCSELSIPDITLNELESLASKTSNDKAPVILHLDEFNDPRNFGNVLRTAAYFDIDMITFSKKNSCPVSPTVAVVSSGAVEELSASDKLRTISGKLNTPNFLEIAASTYNFNVYGTCLTRDAMDISEMKLNKKPTILVFGNEGKGLRKQVLDVCDHLYKIPTGGNMRNNNNNTDNTNKKISSVDSLNVGVSVGISLWQLLST